MFKMDRVKLKSIGNMTLGIMLTILGVESIIHETVFGGLWYTLIGIVFTVTYIYDIFNKKGVPQYQSDAKANNSYKEKEKSFDEKLRTLKALKDDGLISEEEYEVKRREILNDKW